MDNEIEELACGLINKTYVHQGVQNLKTRRNQLKRLLEHKKLPDVGWNDSVIEQTINELSAMDSNNFESNCGVGEREGRIFSTLVARRHFSLSHGIGVYDFEAC